MKIKVKGNPIVIATWRFRWHSFEKLKVSRSKLVTNRVVPSCRCEEGRMVGRARDGGHSRSHAGGREQMEQDS